MIAAHAPPQRMERSNGTLQTAGSAAGKLKKIQALTVLMSTLDNRLASCYHLSYPVAQIRAVGNVPNPEEGLSASFTLLQVDCALTAALVNSPEYWWLIEPWNRSRQTCKGRIPADPLVPLTDYDSSGDSNAPSGLRVKSQRLARCLHILVARLPVLAAAGPG